MRQRQTHSRVGARLSAAAACRKLSMWRTPRVAPRLIALALATLRFPPRVPLRAYLLSRAVLSQRDRPRSVHRAPPPVRRSAHSRVSFHFPWLLVLLRAPRRFSSLSLSLPRSRSRFSRPLSAHASLFFSLSSPISILFPHFPLRFRRISAVFFLFPFTPLNPSSVTRLFFSLFFVFSPSLTPWHTAVPSRLRAAEKVFRRLILPKRDTACVRKLVFLLFAMDTRIFPFEQLTFVVISQVIWVVSH